MTSILLSDSYPQLPPAEALQQHALDAGNGEHVAVARGARKYLLQAEEAESSGLLKDALVPNLLGFSHTRAEACPRALSLS